MTGKTMNNSKTAKTKVKQAIEALDFQKIKRVVDCLKWKYFHSQQADGIPSVAELKSCARMVLYDLLRANDNRSASCGGFVATRDKLGDISLYFAVDHFCDGDLRNEASDDAM